VPFEFIRERVLQVFPDLAAAEIAPLGRGLINQTFLVEGQGRRFVLQRLSPIFSPAINRNIAAVTAALAASGVETPRLVETREGDHCLDLGGEGGVWRLLTFVAGVSFDKIRSPSQARAAGTLVARFHRALDGLDHAFVGLREGVHDTAKHMSRLREALHVHAGHHLIAEVRPLAEAILARARSLAPLPALPPRICHGDLKINNFLFAGETPPADEQAVCLVDLDTVGPLPLAFELGDAWRSWCNLSGEDDTQARIDLDVFSASFGGYAAALGRTLDGQERRALLGGPEWISLELACRFAADALFENYFGWDAARFATRGDHNLLRSRGQLALHEAFVATRAERARILGVDGEPHSAQGEM
jgi:Ser/Thr protein kinase RdoA (MazF antagonist)